MPGWFQTSGSPRDPSGDEGEESSFREGLEEHLKARVELLAIEAREASTFAARKGVLGFVIGAFAFFSYALLLTSAVSLLGSWLERSWPDTFDGIGWQMVALFAGVLHFLLAFILFKILKRKPDQALFEYTRAEFQKDRQWLNPPKTKTPGNENENSP